MRHIRIHTEVSLEEFLSQVEQLDTADLEVMLDRLLREQARRRGAQGSEAETRLLEAINASLPPDEQLRYQHLQHKRQTETLSQAEQQELVQLTENWEALALRRTQHLIQLAALRGQTLAEVQADLGIGAQYE
ncbi:MAG: STAS/SEC14 domain-containing protein [Bacteroidetes bacterium]|nr:MAG: STAS/SEC14 domain-containing protein [Bacteroidota bacterium]